MSAPLIIDAQGVQAWYGSSHILHGIDFKLARGETVGLLRASADFGVVASQREYDRGRDDQRKAMEAAAERNGGVDLAAGRKLAHVTDRLRAFRDGGVDQLHLKARPIPARLNGPGRAFAVQCGFGKHRHRLGRRRCNRCGHIESASQ